MGDSLSALTRQLTTGNVLGSIANPISGASIANPPQLNLLGAYTGAMQAAGGAWNIQKLKAEQAYGETLQAATGPDGTVDWNRFNALASQRPEMAMAMPAALDQSSKLTTEQIANTSARYNTYGKAAASLMLDPSDENVEAIRASLKASGLPAAQVDAELDRIKALPQPQRVKEAYAHNLAALDASGRLTASGYGMPVQTQMPQGLVTQTVRPATPYGQAGATAAGVLPATLSPSEVMNLGFSYVEPQTGKPVHVSGPDRVKAFGYSGLLPPGAVEDSPGAAAAAAAKIGATSSAPTVVNQDGKPVSASNPPRLLPVPPAPNTAPASNAPAPAASAPAVAPVPSGATGTPPAPAAPAPASNAAPVIPFSANTPAPSLADRALAAVNALNPLRIGSAEAAVPTPLQAGAVTPPRVTPAGYTFSVGATPEQAVGIDTSAKKLAEDSVAAADFQRTQFPYVQALKNYGEGAVTGPTTDFWNSFAGYIRTPLAKLGMNIGLLNDNTERTDALNKWLANIQAGNPVSSRSDAQLAQVLKGSATSHINETTGADMVKAGLALQRIQVAATREWQNNPALQQQYGTYLRFLTDYNNRIDPRAFAIDTLNPAQKKRLNEQIQNMTEAEAQRFEYTKDLAERNGLLSGAGSQAMP